VHGTEQYSQSVEDFKSSLAVLKTCVADVTTDRSIAEMHYHIGVACVYAGRYDDGVTNFRSAISILEAKNAALQVVMLQFRDFPVYFCPLCFSFGALTLLVG